MCYKQTSACQDWKERDDEHAIRTWFEIQKKNIWLFVISDDHGPLI